jgi:glutathione S-transferase
MAKLQLVIGNKNYSSWSMRPWVLLRQAQIPFEEVQLQFGKDVRVIGIEKYSRAGKVPVLLVDGDAVWDTLAIAETLAELHPGKHLWPEGARARRVARSACAEMHSGFQSLRDQMPMNIKGSHPGKGLTPESQKDIDRIVALWNECREKDGETGGSGGPLLFGRFSIADAFFAPVVMRFRTYGVELPRAAKDYCAAVESLAAVREWIEAAQKEKKFVAADEPYSKK